MVYYKQPMSPADAHLITEDDPHQGMTLRRADLVDKLGWFGAELFDRLDFQHKNGDEVAVLTVREARTQLATARQRGHGKVVKPQKGNSGSEDMDEFLMISLADITDAFAASTMQYDWAQAFAPRKDLPAATRRVEIKRGVRGRRVSL